LENSKISISPFYLGNGEFLRLVCGLTSVLYPVVSTTFPPSFFTVMPKGLITDPKSRLDYCWHFQTAKILNSSSITAR